MRHHGWKSCDSMRPIQNYWDYVTSWVYVPGNYVSLRLMNGGSWLRLVLQFTTMVKRKKGLTGLNLGLSLTHFNNGVPYSRSKEIKSSPIIPLSVFMTG